MHHLRFLLPLIIFAGLLRAAPVPKNIIFFGDSLTYGYGLEDPANQSFPALIQKKITAAGMNYKVVNGGLSGDTSAGGLRRIDWVLKQKVDVLVLALGANDGLRGIDPSDTEGNLNNIIYKVRRKYPDATVLLAGMKMPDSLGAEFVKEYAEVFPAVAARQGVTLIPFLLDGVAGRRDLNQADGIHPNAAGAVIVADNVWKTLAPMLLPSKVSD